MTYAANLSSYETKEQVAPVDMQQLYTVKPAHLYFIPMTSHVPLDDGNEWFDTSKISKENKKESIEVRSLIYPGSFNPPHHGHLGIIKAAKHLHPDRKIYIEINIKPHGKPALDYITIFEKVSKLKSYFSTVIDGIVVTSATYFVDKVVVLGYKHYYVIGSDTFNRLFDPVFNEGINFKDMIGFFHDVGVKFLVTQRQGVELKNWDTYKHLCTLIPPEVYQDDGVSSTQIRQKEATNNE